MEIDTAKSSGMRRQPRQVRSQERVHQILEVAEQIFIAGGYAATTTKEIAARAKVPIGSLYQFFPDKAAIVKALAIRYIQQLHHRFAELEAIEFSDLPLSIYVDRLIDITDRFFTDYPRYHAIFMQVQGTISELEELEHAADVRLITKFGNILVPVICSSGC
jgi:AcrR family transcriptional regulator